MTHESIVKTLNEIADKINLLSEDENTAKRYLDGFATKLRLCANHLADIHYFQPKKHLEYSYMLLPQKIIGGKQYKYDNKRWVELWHNNEDSINFKALKQNFTEVSTEEECIS